LLIANAVATVAVSLFAAAIGTATRNAASTRTTASSDADPTMTTRPDRQVVARARTTSARKKTIDRSVPVACS